MYYKKIKVPDYPLMCGELKLATADKVSINKRFWDEPYIWFKYNAPLFYNFIEANRKTYIRLCRFYLTPPYDMLLPHIDGLTNNKSPIGLNFPIIGSEDTTMDWYESPENNLIDGPYGFGGITASRVVDFSKLIKVDTTTIDCPTFVRTDVIHGVTNRNKYKRLVLSIRFPYTKTTGQEFTDVMSFENLV